MGLGGKGAGGLNSHSHQWAEAGLGGSRYGSGARGAEEEEGMLAAVEEEGEEDLGTNPWGRNQSPAANSEGGIRL